MLRDKNSELYFPVLLPNFLTSKFVDSLCTIIPRNLNCIVQSKVMLYDIQKLITGFLKHYF